MKGDTISQTDILSILSNKFNSVNSVKYFWDYDVRLWSIHCDVSLRKRNLPSSIKTQLYFPVSCWEYVIEIYLNL